MKHRQAKISLDAEKKRRHSAGMEKLDAYLKTKRWHRRNHEFAKLCGITQSYLSDLRNGKKTPTLQVASRIASASGGRVPMSAWVKKEGASA